MLNRTQHETVLSKILFALFTHQDLKQVLGFKGGTACYFFYNLPRFSTDLDFNLIKPVEEQSIINTVQELIKDFGQIKEAYIKRYTLFLLLSYQKNAYNVKIEISRRISSDNKYIICPYLGLSIQVMEKSCAAAHKLVAVTERARMLSRDLFDAHYFLKNNWPIKKEIVEQRTGKSFKEYLSYMAEYIQKKGTEKFYILHEIGELLEPKQKQWVKAKLMDELLFLIRLRAQQE